MGVWVLVSACVCVHACVQVRWRHQRRGREEQREGDGGRELRMKGYQRGGRGVWEREGGREGWSGEGSDSWTERWKEGRLATTRIRNKGLGTS